MKQKEFNDLKGFELAFKLLNQGLDMTAKDGEQATAQNRLLGSIALSLIEIQRMMMLNQR